MAARRDDEPVLRRRLVGLAIAAGIATADQVLKNWITGPLHLRQKGVIELLPFFDLRYQENPGISYGLLSPGSMEMRIALAGVTVLIALGVFIWLLRERKAGDILALAMVLGGAVGNIIDRAIYTFVIDYADLHFGTWRPFAIFNLADMAITLGVLLLLARALLIRDTPGENGERATMIDDSGSDARDANAPIATAETSSPPRAGPATEN